MQTVTKLKIDGGSNFCRIGLNCNRKPFLHFGFRPILRTTLLHIYKRPPSTHRCKPSAGELITQVSKYKLGSDVYYVSEGSGRLEHSYTDGSDHDICFIEKLYGPCTLCIVHCTRITVNVDVVFKLQQSLNWLLFLSKIR